MSNFKLAYNLLRRPDGTFNRHLAEFLDRKVPANVNPVDGVFSFDTVIDRSINLWSRVYRPAENDTQGVVLLIHRQIVQIYDILCRRLVGLCNAVVVSVNYRRAPEDPYPSAYHDGWTALEWVNSRPWLQSKDSKVHIFLAGDSSGGNIVHQVALRAVKSDIQVLGNILLNPMFGGETRTESEKRTIRCNPLVPRSVSLEGVEFPKSLVVVAGYDLIQDWQLAYANGLKKAGQKVKLLFREKATIGFYLLPNNDHFHIVMDEIRNFVKPTSECE
ncbi:gibberellin receptor GID1C-like protein [Tanacetum coccineum]